MLATQPYLSGLPVGWYETEATISVEGNTEAYREFVVVSEQSQPKFERFIKHLAAGLPPQWEDEGMGDEYAMQQAMQWEDEFFAPDDNANGLLNADLIKIARHVAGAKQAPPFHSFAERDRHNLDTLAADSLDLSERIVQSNLLALYQDETNLWHKFYRSYDRFKTAFDAQRNRLFHIQEFGVEPVLTIAAPIERRFERRELSEDDKRQVFQRDNYTCLCCGKSKKDGAKKRVINLQVDHINAVFFGGGTNLGNSQTLCGSLQPGEGYQHSINFLVLKTPLSSPKKSLDLKLSSRERRYLRWGGVEANGEYFLPLQSCFRSSLQLPRE